MNILVSGGAGFIGSHLIDALLEQDHRIVCVDNFELGVRENLKNAQLYSSFILKEGDASSCEFLIKIIEDYQIEMIYHLAANSDIQKSAIFPEIDYKNTFFTTYAILEAMRQTGIKKLFFASTSAVYGEKTGVELFEDTGNLSPISYYGGAKLASEAFISSYAYMNDFDVIVFRFPNVIGPRLTHGVIFDFIKKLKINPAKLKILGNGQQQKPYLYVFDLVEAILKMSQSIESGVQIYNVGVEDVSKVVEIADMVCEEMGLSNIKYVFTGGDRGWKGDVPQFQYNLNKIHQGGWRASHTSNEAVLETLKHVVRESGI